MNIYLIVRKDSHNYIEENFAHVIVANNEEEVVKLAKSYCRDENPLLWDSSNITRIGIYNGVEKEPHVVLTKTIY